MQRCQSDMSVDHRGLELNGLLVCFRSGIPVAQLFVHLGQGHVTTGFLGIGFHATLCPRQRIACPGAAHGQLSQSSVNLR